MKKSAPGFSYLLNAVLFWGIFAFFAGGMVQAGEADQTSQTTANAPRAKLVFTREIWNTPGHDGFPDLIRFQNKWVCCLREGERHVGGRDGNIRIISSADGQEWKSAALITEAGVDLRDPSLSVTPDGRLMLVCGGSVFDDLVVDGRTIKNHKYVERQSRVAFSKDGEKWTAPQKILTEGHWLWKVTWHKGKAYGLSKTGYDASPSFGILKKVPRGGYLYTSTDGLNWTLITEWEKPVADLVSETRLRFTDDDEMIAFIRPVFMGTSKPPYKEWTFLRTERALQGPNFLILPDNSFWVSTRYYTQLTPAQQKELKTGKKHRPHQALARVNRKGIFEEVLLLPGGGDTGYSGLVWHEDHLWMGYYGSGGIHFAKVRISQ